MPCSIASWKRPGQLHTRAIRVEFRTFCNYRMFLWNSHDHVDVHLLLHESAAAPGDGDCCIQHHSMMYDFITFLFS